MKILSFHFNLLHYVLIGIFFLGFFITLGNNAEAAVFGKGWYLPTYPSDGSCSTTRGYFEFYDLSGNPIIPDEISIFAGKWVDVDRNGSWDTYINLHDPEWFSPGSSSFLTPCYSETATNQWEVVLQNISIKKAGYEPLFAINYSHLGPWVNKRIMNRIYLALDSEPINVANVFPVDNQILTSNSVSFQVYVDKRPAASDIDFMSLTIINTTIGQSFFRSLNPLINTGTFSFPSQFYPDGNYQWSIWYMTDTGGYLYDYVLNDFFIIDTAAPSISASHSPPSPTNLNTVTVSGTAQDTTSGLDWIQVYIDGVLTKTCDYSGTISSTCNALAGPYAPDTNHTYYAIVSDMAGHQSTSSTGNFTIIGPDLISQNLVPQGILEAGQILTFNGDIVNQGTSAILSFSNPEDFESNFTLWHNITADTCDWIRDQAGTPSRDTGPNHDNTIGDATGWYAYMETSIGYCFTAGNEAIIIEGPNINADSGNVQLSFYYHMYGAQMGTLNVDVFNGASWDMGVWSISGQQHASEAAAYTQATVDLSSYTGTIQIRFRGTAAGNWHGDIALDDIEIFPFVNYESGYAQFSLDPAPIDGNYSIDLGRFPVGPLGIGASQNVTSNSWTAQGGTHRIQFCADDPSPGFVEESDETNNCTTYDFEVPLPANNPPSSTSHQGVQGDNCGVASPPVTFSWTFSDSDGNSQSAYQVKIYEGVALVHNSGKVSNSSQSYAPPLGIFSYNTTYNWTLEVWDDYTNPASSGTISGPDFTTPVHQYPNPSFTWSPSVVGEDEVVTFTNTSTTYGGSSNISRAWTFQDGTPDTSTKQNPKVAFSPIGLKSVTIEITDSDGFTCTISPPETVNVKVPFPDWEEVTPFGVKAFDFFAALFKL